MAGVVIPARLFGPGLPAGGADVEIEPGLTTLRLRGAAALQVDYTTLKSRAGGFSHDSLNLGWASDAGEYALLIQGERERSAFMAAAPQSLQEVLRPYRRSVFALNSMLQLLLLLTGGVVLAAGLLVWQYDAAVGWVAGQVPVETETRIGRMGLESMQEEWELRETGPLVELVATLGNRLTTGSRYQYQWFVADDDMVNAMALPGGTVIVFRGLLESADSVEELAGVLAHEVQHIEQQHSLRNMIHSAGWAALLGITLGDVSGIVAVLAHQVGASFYSRELEAAADAGGIRALHAAGLDPAGLIAFFSRLSEDDDSDSEVANALVYLSSHPAPTDRITAAEQLIHRLPPREYSVLELDLNAALAAPEGTAQPEP